MRYLKSTVLKIVIISAGTATLCSGRTPFAEAQAHIVHFPSNRSMGMLYILDRKLVDTSSYSDWKPLCEATGDVAVPEGEALPNFDGIKIDLPAQDSKSRRLLVCFFDMNQRPSRSRIRQLSEKTEQFRQKGVIVAAVQAAQIEESTLTEWIKKYNIGLKVGRVTDGTEKTRFAWGVKSLPWLILADSKHTIRAEGFGISELNQKIGETADAQR